MARAPETPGSYRRAAEDAEFSRREKAAESNEERWMMQSPRRDGRPRWTTLEPHDFHRWVQSDRRRSRDPKGQDVARFPEEPQVPRVVTPKVKGLRGIRSQERRRTAV